MRNRATKSPPSERTCPVFDVSSQRASSRPLLKRMCGMTSKASAHSRRYVHISGCGGYVHVQSALGANENEYRLDGTSHVHPGYVLSRHVPPTSSARSSMMKSSMPACLRRIAMPRPANPVPTMTAPTRLASVVVIGLGSFPTGALNDFPSCSPARKLLLEVSYHR